jgi:hypothetical protein
VDFVYGADNGGDQLVHVHRSTVPTIFDITCLIGYTQAISNASVLRIHLKERVGLALIVRSNAHVAK